MNQRRKRPARQVLGWLIFDKPHGMGSTDAVAFVKRLYRADKAGHAGTLDPLATGILPIALGEATKTVPYLMDERKSYRFAIAWGEERTTDDLEGAVTQRSEMRPTRAEIEAMLPRFTGSIQEPSDRSSKGASAGWYARSRNCGQDARTLPHVPGARASPGRMRSAR